jgi:hypothetical protein
MRGRVCRAGFEGLEYREQSDRSGDHRLEQWTKGRARPRITLLEACVARQLGTENVGGTRCGIRFTGW